MQKRNLSPEQIQIALPLLKAGIKPGVISAQYGMHRKTLSRLCVKQRAKGVPIPVWRHREAPRYGTLKALMVSAGPAAISWVIEQTPQGSTIAETIGAILADVAAEEQGK
jgi:hypothetical protein